MSGTKRLPGGPFSQPKTKRRFTTRKAKSKAPTAFDVMIRRQLAKLQREDGRRYSMDPQAERILERVVEIKVLKILAARDEAVFDEIVSAYVNAQYPDEPLELLQDDFDVE